MPPFPVNANQPEKSCGGRGGIMKHGTNGKGYGDFLAIGLVHDCQHRSFQVVPQHTTSQLRGADVFNFVPPASSKAIAKPHSGVVESTFDELSDVMVQT